MQSIIPRSARLVLVRPDGSVAGALPPFPVDTPWWPDAAPVVRGARERFGLDIVVLRVIDSELGRHPGGEVTYLAETLDEPPPAMGLHNWEGELEEHPMRMPWARPGGPRADLAWADDALIELGLPRSGDAVQIRTWNLSSLWRLPIRDSNAWLKVVPPFFRHEGAVLAALAGGPIPRILAHDAPNGRILLEEIGGDDLHDAGLEFLGPTIDLLVGLQVESIGRIEELLALGLPDWRAPALGAGIRAAIERTAPELTAADRRTLDVLLDGLDARWAAIAGCGLPETLVHGDFIPGNARGGRGHPLTLLDWGDSGVGHPLLDEAAFFERALPGVQRELQSRWHDAWRRALPGSDPDRAARLIAPIAASRQAVIFWTFLDGSEPSEQAYHRAEPAVWLGRSAALVRAEPGGSA